MLRSIKSVSFQTILTPRSSRHGEAMNFAGVFTAFSNAIENFLI